MRPRQTPKAGLEEEQTTEIITIENKREELNKGRVRGINFMLWGLRR